MKYLCSYFPIQLLTCLPWTLPRFGRSGEAAGRTGASLRKDLSGPSLRCLFSALAHKNRPDVQAGWVRSDPVRDLSVCCSALCHSGSSEPTHSIPLSLPAQAFVGGAEEIRTPDLRRAKAALSQLSYGPTSLKRDSYYWWAMVDSNHRPRSYQDRALTG